MSKHTRGQWYAVAAWVEHEDDNVADICTCDPAALGQECLGRSYEEMHANAVLIAAAPALLRALKRLERKSGLLRDDPARVAARQAIKTAEAV